MEAGGGITRNQEGKRRRLSERTWRELFERFDSAGLTVEAFCQREGLSRSSFNRWRSRLPMQPRTAAATVSALNATPLRACRCRSAPNFPQLRFDGSEVTLDASGVRVMELAWPDIATLRRRPAARSDLGLRLPAPAALGARAAPGMHRVIGVLVGCNTRAARVLETAPPG